MTKLKRNIMVSTIGFAIRALNPNLFVNTERITVLTTSMPIQSRAYFIPDVTIRFLILKPLP